MDTKPNSLLHNPTHNPILLTHPTKQKQITNNNNNIPIIYKAQYEHIIQNHTGPNYVT